MKVGEYVNIGVESRGSMGLQLGYNTFPEYIVDVTALEGLQIADDLPGDPVMVVFTITALKKGRCKLIFSESQPWNLDFEPIIKGVYDIAVEE